MKPAHLALLFIVLGSTGCRLDRVLGSLICNRAADCAAPAYVCGPDGRCVAGCVASPERCIAGSSCDPATGECVGGNGIGRPCADDQACDPPDLVCRASTQTCVAGCTLAGADACAAGYVCNPLSGRCCDPNDPSCPMQSEPASICNSDSECVGAPANICSAGTCVPGCTSSGSCTAPLTCDTATGHCMTPGCARDVDCDAGSYCTRAGTCAVLAFGGPIACAGGTVVYYHCAVKTTPAEFQSCVGPAGPAGCPYCIEYSCLHAGVCSSDADCHEEDACTQGLCRLRAPECPTTVSVQDILAGKYASGKEVCVAGVVSSVENGYDGYIEIKLGTSPYLFTDVPPMFKAAGVRIPTVGEAVMMHGTVRWNAAYEDRELLPVDWVSP
jgi:hypothetical protein